MSNLCNAGATWSRGKWWLWAILGLLLLFILLWWQTWSNSWGWGVHAVDKDIEARTNSALVESGYGWASTNQGSGMFERNGRDVMLTGSAPSESAKQEAIDIAKAVYGVRVVDSDFDLKQFASPTFGMLEAGDGIILKGQLANQTAVDQVVSSASGLYGAANVDNQLTVSGDVASSAWVADLGAALKAAQSANDAGLVVNDSSVTLTGMVRSDDDKASVYEQVRSALSIDVDNQLTVSPYNSPSIVAKRNGDRLILSGTVQGQQTIDQIVASANGLVGAGNVDNQLTISADTAAVPMQWVSGMGELFSALSGSGAISVAADGVTISGVLPSDGEKSGVLSRVKAQFGGMAVMDQLQVVVPPPPAVEPVAIVQALEPAPVMSAVDICLGRLNGAMKGKKIEFATNSADIGFQSYPLLATLVRVMKDCETYLSTTTLEISGHTDDKGSDENNLALSGRRAAAVLDYLSAAGVNASQLEAKGYGELRPISSNDTAVGRADNRRIQFDIKQ